MEVSYRSDKRVKGGLSDTCKLCKEEKKLLLSHIVPKWMYSFLKNESADKILIGNYPSINKDRVILQDGTKQYLLCSECEQFLGDAENYVKRLMYVPYTVVEPELIQRFIIGIAYKAHYSNIAPYHQITIKKSYLEFIRESLLDKTFREKNFMISAIAYEPSDGVDPKGMVIVQELKLSNKAYMFSMLAGGWEWILIISKYTPKQSNPVFNTLHRNKLSSSGEFPVISAPITDYRKFLLMKENKTLSNNND